MYEAKGVGGLMILGMIFLVLILWLGPVLGGAGLVWLFAPHLGYTFSIDIFYWILGIWTIVMLIVGYVTFKPIKRK